jgi:tetratricopeptide (TPR) repeat protein
MFMEDKKYNLATPFFFTALETLDALKLQENSDYNLTLDYLGDAYFWQKMYKKALRYYLKEKELGNKYKNLSKIDRINLMYKIGYIFEISKNPRKAIPYYLKCKILMLLEKMSTTGRYANLLYHLGVSCRMLKNYSKSHAFLKEAIDVYKRLGNRKMIDNIKGYMNGE